MARSSVVVYSNTRCDNRKHCPYDRDCIENGQPLRSLEVCAVPHPTHLSVTDTALLVIDVQEKLVPKIVEKDRLIRNTAFLIDVFRALEMPVFATEQYPKGLGPTVPELAQRLPERLDKVVFSCAAIPRLIESLQRQGRPKVVLTGMETHVCVLNTALDLLTLGFRVYLAADAISSRSRFDDEIAFRRLEQAGAILTTVEMVAFETTHSSAHPAFKQISQLVRAREA